MSASGMMGVPVLLAMNVCVTLSDVHGLASEPSQAKSVGLELALAWPGLPESQSQWPRPWL